LTQITLKIFALLRIAPESNKENTGENVLCINNSSGHAVTCKVSKESLGLAKKNLGEGPLFKELLTNEEFYTNLDNFEEATESGRSTVQYSEENICLKLAPWEVQWLQIH
jgi:hypothetical protein